MGLNLKIEASIFRCKPLPLSVITGGQHGYGNTDEYVQTMLGEVGKSDFIAFDPEHIGRGFQVEWHEGERKRVSLRLPLPCCRGDLVALYAAVERIAAFWRGTLWVEDEKTSLTAFMDTLEERIAQNEQFVQMMAKTMLSKPESSLEVCGAMWPLRPGREEAERFLQAPGEFDRWLHEKQVIDACYWPVGYELLQDGQSAIGGTIFEPLEVPYIYLDKVPPAGFTIEGSTPGSRIPVSQWMIVVEDDDGQICKIPYAEFRAKLPEDKISRYDAQKILIQPMTGEEIRAIYTPKEE